MKHHELSEENTSSHPVLEEQTSDLRIERVISAKEKNRMRENNYEGLAREWCLSHTWEVIEEFEDFSYHLALQERGKIKAYIVPLWMLTDEGTFSKKCGICAFAPTLFYDVNLASSHLNTIECKQNFARLSQSSDIGLCYQSNSEVQDTDKDASSFSNASAIHEIEKVNSPIGTNYCYNFDHSSECKDACPIEYILVPRFCDATLCSKNNNASSETEYLLGPKNSTPSASEFHNKSQRNWDNLNQKQSRTFFERNISTFSNISTNLIRELHSSIILEGFSSTSNCNSCAINEDFPLKNQNSGPKSDVTWNSTILKENSTIIDNIGNSVPYVTELSAKYTQKPNEETCKSSNDFLEPSTSSIHSKCIRQSSVALGMPCYIICWNYFILLEFVVVECFFVKINYFSSAFEKKFGHLVPHKLQILDQLRVMRPVDDARIFAWCLSAHFELTLREFGINYSVPSLIGSVFNNFPTPTWPIHSDASVLPLHVRNILENPPTTSPSILAINREPPAIPCILKTIKLDFNESSELFSKELTPDFIEHLWACGFRYDVAIGEHNDFPNVEKSTNEQEIDKKPSTNERDIIDDTIDCCTSIIRESPSIEPIFEVSNKSFKISRDLEINSNSSTHEGCRPFKLVKNSNFPK